MAIDVKEATKPEPVQVTVTEPKAAEPASKPVANKVTIILEHGDFESVMACLIIANASAAMEQETNIFFTFWGLFPLLRDEVRFSGRNWMQRMLFGMNRGGISHLKTSKLNFGGMGPAMFNALRRKYQVASPKEMLEMAQEMGVKFYPCQMTLDLMGFKAEHLIDGLEPPAGAAGMLGFSNGGTTLFI